MIVEFINKDYAAIWLKLLIVSAAWFCVLAAMLIDLYFGVRKSKSIGEATSSEGFRRSIQKFCYYYAMLLFALIFDTLNPLPFYLPFPLSVMPIVTLLCALALVFTEAKSVRENAEDKLRRKTDRSFKELLSVLEKREDVVSKIFEYLQTEKNKQDEKTDPGNPADPI